MTLTEVLHGTATLMPLHEVIEAEGLRPPVVQVSHGCIRDGCPLRYRLPYGADRRHMPALMAAMGWRLHTAGWVCPPHAALPAPATPEGES